MQSLPLGTYVMIANTSRYGGGGGGGSDPDDVLEFVKIINWMLGGILATFLLFMGVGCWATAVVHRESFKTELTITDVQATSHRSGKHGKYVHHHWTLTFKDSKGNIFSDRLARNDNTVPFKVNDKFTTLIVWHLTRRGDKFYYFPDLNKDIPRIKTNAN